MSGGEEERTRGESRGTVERVGIGNQTGRNARVLREGLLDLGVLQALIGRRISDEGRVFLLDHTGQGVGGAEGFEGVQSTARLLIYKA